ncbi:MAG: amidohydrolase family protein [Planctomycetes bacterium]|nr:amidohydrolase family protein [Planctomycetota bacterium]
MRKSCGAVLAILGALPLSAQEEHKEQVVVIRAAKILTMGPQGVVNRGVILVRGGRIVEVGENVTVPEGATVLDAGESWAVPGFIDLHCHIAGSMWDINEMNHPRNPELDTLSTIDPESERLKIAAAAGVTTVLYIPGSGTSMSGFGVLLNTGGGRTIDDLVLRFPGALKIAHSGNNPRRSGGDLGTSRMGLWWAMRRALGRAKAYHEAWTNFEKGRTRVRPARQPDLDLMRGLFEGKYPVIVHTVDAGGVMGTARILGDEYGLRVIVSHGEFGGYRVAPEMARRGLHCNIGPRLIDIEAPGYGYIDRGAFWGIAAKYFEAGCTDLSINTDAPVVPQEDLAFQAAMCVRYGLPVDAALRGLTIAPARAVLADRWVGSLEPGKHADVVLWSGEPLDVRSYVRTTIIRGKVVYDAVRDGRRY